MHFHPLRSLALAAALAATVSGGLMTPVTAHAAAPAIITFACPLDNGGGRFYCNINYSSDSTATVTWAGDGNNMVINEAGHSDFYGSCYIGSNTTVTVTVTNASGSTSRSKTFKCNGGAVIL